MRWVARAFGLGLPMVATVFVLTVVMADGCTSKPSEETEAVAASDEPVSEDGTAETTPAASPPGPVTRDPKETVTRFLTALKSGNGPGVEALLTSKARTELPKHHMKVEPLGSAEARFEVVDVKYAKGKPNVAYVACRWSEPPVAGEASEPIEVVWVTKKVPSVGWRVSGMAMDGPTGDVVLFNFEDPADMLRQKDALVKSYQELAAPSNGPTSTGPPSTGPRAETAAKPTVPSGPAPAGGGVRR